MNTKLTLKLDSTIIEQAKTYAKNKNISLSKLIESYLGLLIDPKEKQLITPLVKSISGIIQPENIELKEEYKKHLVDKYSK